MIWSHDDLVNDLAGHLKAPERMVWTDMQLGPSGSPRPDVYVISKSYVNPQPTAYECKISVEDFRSDVCTGKWTRYLEYAFSVTFACPAGLISKTDVPAQCGLIVRHETVWKLAKRPVVNPCVIPQQALLKLLIDGVKREGPEARCKWWNHWDITRRFAAKFGSEAARYVSDAASTHERIEHAERHAQIIRERAEQNARQIMERALKELPDKWRALTSSLGLNEDSSGWRVDEAIRNLRSISDTQNSERLSALVGELRAIIRREELADRKRNDDDTK